MVFFLEETKYIPDPNEAIAVPTMNREGRSSVVGEGLVDPSNVHDEKTEKPAASNNAADDTRHGSVVSVEYDPAQASTKRRIVEIDPSIPVRSWKRRHAWYTTNGALPVTYEWWRHLTQPFVLLFIFPAVAFSALQWAFCLAALSLVAVSTSDLYPFPPYNFSAVGVGNMNIPPAIGSILGTIWGGPCVDWTIVKLAQRNGGIYEPEMRLVLMSLSSTLMPIGVFM